MTSCLNSWPAEEAQTHLLHGNLFCSSAPGCGLSSGGSSRIFRDATSSSTRGAAVWGKLLWNSFSRRLDSDAWREHSSCLLTSYKTSWNFPYLTSKFLTPTFFAIWGNDLFSKRSCLNSQDTSGLMITKHKFKKPFKLAASLRKMFCNRLMNEQKLQLKSESSFSPIRPGTNCHESCQKSRIDSCVEHADGCDLLRLDLWLWFTLAEQRATN